MRPLPFINRNSLLEATLADESDDQVFNYVEAVSNVALDYYVNHGASGKECAKFLEEMLLLADIEPDCVHAWQICHQEIAL